jgi:hypothetical protein
VHTSVGQAPLFLGDAHGELLPPLAASAVNYLATLRRAHALAKTVCAFPASTVRLVGPLHFILRGQGELASRIGAVNEAGGSGQVGAWGASRCRTPSPPYIGVGCGRTRPDSDASSMVLFRQSSSRFPPTRNVLLAPVLRRSAGGVRVGAIFVRRSIGESSSCCAGDPSEIWRPRSTRVRYGPCHGP